MLCRECLTPLWGNGFCVYCLTVRPYVVSEKEKAILLCTTHGEFDPKIFSAEEDGRLCPYCSTLLSSKVYSYASDTPQTLEMSRDAALKAFFTGMVVS